MKTKMIAAFFLSGLISLPAISVAQDAPKSKEPNNLPKPIQLQPVPAAATPAESELVVSANTAANGINPQNDKCYSRYMMARKMCLESLSPDLQKTMPLVMTMINAAKSSGIAESCSKFSKALELANTALTAYGAACTAAKLACDMSCSDSLKQIQAAEGYPTKKYFMNMDTVKAQSQMLAKECEGHAQRLTAAGIGLLGIIAESKKSSECEKKVAAVDCNLNPTDPTCIKKVDCALDENKTKTECICAKAPTTPGCAGAGPGNGDNNYQQQTGNKDYNQKDSNLTGNVDTSGNSGDGFVSPNGGGGNSLAGGGGAAGGDSGRGGGLSGGQNAQKNGKTADGKTLNPNILSGYEGGGGGGGGRGGKSGSGSDYDKYMPGGQKDPSRNVASQVFANGEVTGSGGKSNWEKVTERYRDNKPKLMTGP